MISKKPKGKASVPSVWPRGPRGGEGKKPTSRVKNISSQRPFETKAWSGVQLSRKSPASIKTQA